MSERKTENKVVRIVTYILVVLLLIGLLGGIVSLLKRSVGMYVDYNGTVITSDNDGIAVTCSNTETVTFTISNTKDWGLYSVEDCTVKVVNNVSSSSKYDFEYMVDGSTVLFSESTDFTGVFAVDGETVTVNEDGTFELAFKYTSMADLLQAYTGTTVILSDDIFLSSCPYFAIQITSPDEKTVITIPFIIDVIMSVTGIVIAPESIIF